MRQAILTIKDAERLNSTVQNKLDPTLFLCCNYSPTWSYAYSEDGYFLTSVQDLYKFAFDTSCIIRNWYEFIPESEQHRFKKLKWLLGEISMLRTVIDHNQNELNGDAEKECLERYQSWMMRLIKKDKPDKPEDFSILNGKLETMAKDILSQLEEFIECVSCSPDKEKYVELWKNKTVEWYSSGKKSMYWSFLQMEYRSRAMKNRQEIPLRELNRKVNKWIYKALERYNVADSVDSAHKFFFDTILKLQLEETYRQLKEEEAVVTLLPQDFLAEDIRRNFYDVPSPEDDF